MPTEATRGPVIVLVHGAWHGSWCWELLVPELAARGWRTSTVDLPSASGDPAFGMYDDARTIREHVDGIDEPVVLLAHSYGGLAATEAAGDAGGVRQLIYLAAHQLEKGDSVASSVGGAWFPPDTSVLPPPEDPRVLFNDLPEAEAAHAMAQLRPQSARAFTEELTQASWKTIPAGYILCEGDQSLSPDSQEQWSRRANVVHRVPTSHSPFLSRPAELADTIGEISTALDSLPTRTG